MAETYADVAPTIAQYATEAEATALVPAKPAPVGPETPALDKAAVQMVIGYVRYLGVNFIPAKDGQWASNGFDDIAKRVSQAGHQVTVEQVRTLHEEWKRFEAWKASGAVGHLGGEVEP